MGKRVGDFIYEEESYKIRGAAFAVWEEFRGVFKEKVIENSLKRELQDKGLIVDAQKRIIIYFKGEKVGIYKPDFIVNNVIIIELKAKPFIGKEDERQFWYYLKGSDYKLGFLINFGPQKLEIKRRIYDKARNKLKSALDQRTNQR